MVTNIHKQVEATVMPENRQFKHQTQLQEQETRNESRKNS